MQDYVIENNSGLQFVADNTVRFIAVAGANLILSEVNTLNFYLQQGDNIFIREIGFFVPYQYSRGSLGDSYIELQWQNRLGTATGTLFGFGGAFGRVFVPEFNQWQAINSFCSYPALAAGDYRLRVSLVNANVNQINGPAILNGDTITCKIAMRVSSNFLMSA